MVALSTNTFVLKLTEHSRLQVLFHGRAMYLFYSKGLDCAYETVQNWLLVQHEAAETNPNHQDSSSACASVSYPKLDFRNMALSDIIVERKSEFLGHAIRISSPDEVCT